MRGPSPAPPGPPGGAARVPTRRPALPCAALCRQTLARACKRSCLACYRTEWHVAVQYRPPGACRPPGTGSPGDRAGCHAHSHGTRFHRAARRHAHINIKILIASYCLAALEAAASSQRVPTRRRVSAGWHNRVLPAGELCVGTSRPTTETHARITKQRFTSHSEHRQHPHPHPAVHPAMHPAMPPGCNTGPATARW